MRRRVHRALGLSLALPLVLWIATGLLFHVKHRYAEAYESLRVPAAPSRWEEARLSPASLHERSLLDTGSPPRLGVTPDGVPVYFGKKTGAPVAIDARSGATLVAASRETVDRWARAAVAASPNANRYGKPVNVHETATFSSLTGVKDPAFTLEFSGGKTVTVDRLTGEITQTGALNDWIDATYRVHYLQWTPWKAVNIAFVLVVSAAALALAFTGLWLSRAKIP